jgi:hypothetical protein
MVAGNPIYRGQLPAFLAARAWTPYLFFYALLG